MWDKLVRRFAGLCPRRRLRIAFAAVAALTVLLAFLFVRTQAVDLDAQNRIMLYMRELQQLDAQWDANIQRAHSGVLAQNVPLAAQVPRMHELLAPLGEAARANGPATSAAYGQLVRALRRKEQLVGQLSLHNPPLRAALIYVPPAGADLKTELGGIEGALAPGRIILRMDASLNELLTQILRFNLAPTPALAARIEATLGDIEGQEIAFSPAIVEAIDRLAHQCRIILVNRPLENALEVSIAATRSGEAMDQLARQFDLVFTAALTGRQRFRGYLFAYSTLLLVLLAWAGARLRRSYRIIGEVNQHLQAANENLEQRVAERTAALEAQSKQLEMLARHDSLTGLVNVRQLTQLLGHALVRAARRDTVVVVMFIDLDGFKAVNDTWGHATGDLVLQEVARRVQARLRAEDALARLGGDEFVILLEDTNSPEGALRVAQAALDEIEGIREAGGHPVRISASIGIASARGPEGEAGGAEALLAEADHAMYAAKQAGKGRFVISGSARWAP
jgi:diguanylate cyclase (GGDEF)-like protein